MKKLIPAICMTLIAAVMLASSTFAWFSMNTTVTATDMQVVAKSDNTYLLISSTKSTADAIQGDNDTTTALTVANPKVYPCAPVTNSTETSELPGTAIVTSANASTVGNWYTASAGASNKADIDWETAKVLTTFTGFVIQETVYLTVAKGANAANNLKVTPTIAKSGESGTSVEAARVLITTSDGGFAILNKDSGAEDIKGNNTNLTDSTVLTVNIYIYIDGNDATVNTNNSVNLAMATISLLFSVDAVKTA